MRRYWLFVAVLVVTSCCISGEAFARGRGIGRNVSQAARNGVHGPQLAGQVHQFQAGQGIGVVNGGGNNNVGGQGPMNGGQGQMNGGGPAGKGHGPMVGGGANGKGQGAGGGAAGGKGNGAPGGVGKGKN